jgi:hypothetical protein
MILIALTLGVVALALLPASGHGKPGGNPAPLPLGPEVYQWREDLGGWLDTSTNLVWGYDSLEILGYAHNFSGSSSVVATYPQILQNFASSQTDPAIQLVAQNAANVAVQYTNWRMPTLDEARDAMAKKLFVYGPGGLNGYQSVPSLVPVAGGWLVHAHWTSTAGKPIRGGFPSGYVYVPATGDYGLLGQNSPAAGCIVVRTHTPAQ